MNLLLVGVIGYIGLQFLVGFAVSTHIRNEADYLIAGRQLGVILASFSIFATWFGAETVVSAAGSIYEDGLAGGSADPFGYVLCIVIMGLLFARPLWRRGYMTFADLFRERYSPGVERFAILLMAPTSILWSAAQIRAFGQVLSSATQLHVDWAILIATLLVIGYTAVGGLLADAWTDLVQGISLMIGLVIIGLAVLVRSEPIDWHHVASVERLSLFGDQATSWWHVAEAWAVPVVGSVFAAELISRVLACRSENVARQACLIGGLLYLLVGMIPVAIGFVGPSLHPNLAEPEQLIPRLAQTHLGSAGYILFAGALVSAILSTVDSALLCASAMVSHNLLGHLERFRSDRSRLRLARGGVIVFGLIAYGLALHSESIGELIESASSFGSAGIAVASVFGILTPWGNHRCAHAALAIGLIVWLWAKYVAHLSTPYLLALACSTAAYVVVMLVTSANRVAKVAARPLE